MADEITPARSGHLEVAGQKGQVEAITPTQTILREGEKSFILSNSVFLDSVATR